MDLRDPGALERIRRICAGVPFLRHLGIELAALGPGWAEMVLPVGPLLGQAEGFVHAGAVATMADHASGSAAGTLSTPDSRCSPSSSTSSSCGRRRASRCAAAPRCCAPAAG